jgi:hypothetical protein
MEEPVIREKAVECLISLAENQHPSLSLLTITYLEFFDQHFF